MKDHALLAGALAAILAIAAAPACSTRAEPTPAPQQPRSFDPILDPARQSVGRTANLEASVPPQCYTKTDGASNPCFSCHTGGRGLNGAGDWDLQLEYSFSDFALQNRWTNLFADRSAAIAAITDDSIREWIRQDNYGPLRESLRARPDYPGYVPDLDLHAGFDEEGFAKDGSGWRAIRYKPFPGTFWPTNGSTDDVFVRLPPAFRTDASGRASRAIYVENLRTLELALRADRDGDRRIAVGALPARYAGAAAHVPVRRGTYPEGTELLHTVRYVDLDEPSALSRRLKELRYMKKTADTDPWAVARAWEKEQNEKEEGVLPEYPGSPETGYRNAFGWVLQGYIEDPVGRLRLQTEEEHRYCMGCHSAIGVTIDHTFALPRKVPGRAGWQHQDLRGITDVPQLGHDRPEILEYFARVGGGDELRENAEVRAKFWPKGRLDERRVRRAAPGGDRDITFLVMPSKERALLLNKAYRALVAEQSFAKGRDPVVRPAKNVHKSARNGATPLGAAGHAFADGELLLDW
jgi:hypothetical protein